MENHSIPMDAQPLDGRIPPTGSDRPARSCLLTINGGSSSLKFALFHLGAGAPPERFGSGRIERIGLPDARASVSGPSVPALENVTVSAPNLPAAVGWLIDWLEEHIGGAAIAAIVHRVVHGGTHHVRPERITADLVADLRRLAPFDPEHLPGEIALIERFQQRVPDVPQVACFDTAFHHDLPRVAQIVPIPRRFEAAGVRRYGFHGLSYAYLMNKLTRIAGPDAAAGRVVLAHLGSGASLAAVHQGRCVDTTMGLTPVSGLVMGTRSGDVDPGLPWILAQIAGVTPEHFHAIVNHESGLLGVSETSPDLRDLLQRQDHDRRAAEAVTLFFYQARKGIGAMAAALGGLDILVFSGGIGENSPEARARICDGLEFLGIALDDGRNASGAPVISTDGARTQVRAIRTDDESMMAQAAASLLASVSSPESEA
jgi:acetate kinase